MGTKLARLTLVALAAAGLAAAAVAASGGNDVPHASVDPQTPPGPPAMSRGYEVWRSDIVQPRVDITTVGTFRQPATHVLTLHLEAGSYFVWSFVTAGKNSGNGVLRCAVLIPEGAVTFARVSMGDQGGTSRAATLTSHGSYTVPDGGADLELKCTQEPGAAGDTPQVFDAVIDALQVGRFTSNQGS